MTRTESEILASRQKIATRLYEVVTEEAKIDEADDVLLAIEQTLVCVWASLADDSSRMKAASMLKDHIPSMLRHANRRATGEDDNDAAPQHRH